MADLARQPVMAMVPLINMMVALMTMFMDPGMTRKPFRAIWNYPDRPCRSLGIDFHLNNYGIESNSKEFIGDTIALYYTGKAGRWPYFEFENGTDIAVHGGWPFRANFGSHLAHLRDVISKHQSPSSSGYGVIDMELWRPILKTNYGLFLPYREKMLNYVIERNPFLKTNEHRIRANRLWSFSTKLLMLMSLTMAKMTRPNTMWGYYRYPELVTAADNHELKWLWQTVTAFYPSVYIKNYTKPIDVMEEHIKAIIAEAFRVRALYSNPEHPIMVFVDVQTLPKEGMDEFLRLQLQVPIDMGVDGIILWSSSNQFSPKPRSKCLGIQQHIHDKVGPYIADMMEYMSSCSKQLCNDRGRCVRKSYARSIPYLVSRGVKGRGDGEDLVKPFVYRKIYTGFKRDYQCQCYRGWFGRKCVEKAQDEGSI